MTSLSSMIGRVCVALFCLGGGLPAGALERAVAGGGDAVGSSPHEIFVSARGSARISVPLRTPIVDGSAGLALSLEYDAARGGDRVRLGVEDVANYGWYLHGVSLIHRCAVGEMAPNHAHRGENGATVGNGLCLDGERLILIAGAAGTSDAEYRPERDPDTRVRSRLGTDGELWFELAPGDGSLRVYGRSAGARQGAMVRRNWRGIDGKSSSVTAWGLERIDSVAGPDVEITWQGGQPGDIFAPRRISQGEHEIRMSYRVSDARGAPTGPAVRRRLLGSVSVETASRPVRIYRLDHRADEAGHERIVGLQECGFDLDGQRSPCLPPLRFAWAAIKADTPHYPVAIVRVIDGLGAVNEFRWRDRDEDESLGAEADQEHAGDRSAESSLFGPLTVIPDARATRAPLVLERVSRSGASGVRRWRYGYRGRPLVSTRGRGYLGVPQIRESDSGRDIITHAQYRLDWPFVGMLAQRRVFAYTEQRALAEIDREEHRYDIERGPSSVGRPFLATRTRWQLEAGEIVGIDVRHEGPCRVSIAEVPCQGTHAETIGADWLSISDVGTALADGGGQSGLWGDVPPRRMAPGALRSRRIERSVREHLAEPWVRGRVTTRSVTWEAPGVPARTQVETFAYRPGSRAVAQQVQFPGDPALERVIEREFAAAHAMPVSETLRGRGAEQRQWLRIPQGGSVHDGETLINPLGQTTERWHDPRFGLLLRAVEDGSREHRFERDPYGRLVRERRPDQVTTEYRYASCQHTQCPVSEEAAFSVTQWEHVSGVKRGPEQVRVYDALGRLLLESQETLGSSDNRSHVRYSHDAAGRVVGIARAVAPAVPPACRGPRSDCVWRVYDARDRLVTESIPGGGQVRLVYTPGDGQRTVTRTETLVIAGEPAGVREQRVVVDLSDRLVESHSADSTPDAAVNRYRYDAAGNLVSVDVNGERVAAVAWDLAGARVRLEDASAGSTVWQRNGLGEVVGILESGGRTTRFERDALGRVIARHRQDGVTERWQWDPDHARGALAGRSGPGFEERYRHDANGRLESVHTELTLAGQLGGRYQRSFAYDSTGRLVSQRFPNGLELGYRHGEAGLVEAVEMNGATLHAWHALDVAGRPTRESLQDGALWSSRAYDRAGGQPTRLEVGVTASGRRLLDHDYVWQSNGQLALRRERRGSGANQGDLIDRLRYDARNRLIALSSDRGGLNFAYSRQGNLVARRGAGLTDRDSDEFRFPDASAPFELRSARLDGVAMTFTHDSSGRVLRRSGADGSLVTVEHDGLGRVSVITLGRAGAEPSAEDGFLYDPDGRRLVTREVWRDGLRNASRMTLELGGDFERVDLDTESRYDRIDRVDATPALRIVRRRVAETGRWESVVEYVHRDHLGSVALITDGSGRVLERFAYDPFGGRRDPHNGQRLPETERAALLARQDTSGSRGFTDHRHLDRTGFIHMQGRVFDPQTGRFLAPDPLLQDPIAADGFNRYAYVGHDPLSLVDPSGTCGREVGYQLTPCEAGVEHLRVVASRLPGFGLPVAFGSLSYAGASPWTIAGSVSAAGGIRLPDVSLLVPQILAQLDAAGLRSAGAALCLGAILGGCGALSVDTRSGAVYGMLVLGVIPGAGLSIGAEQVLWQSPQQQASGFGTALFVSGGVVGMGGSLALAQGTNGVNLTGTVGYGFGFGGGAGFYYALPLGVLRY